MSHGDPQNPKRNPHPVKRYEITATADAPGPWDSVKGYVIYDVVNLECTRKNEFLGVHIVPQDVGLDIEMTRVDTRTWKGYFYRDHLQDDDYYGLGDCHWDVTTVGGAFVVHGETFAATRMIKNGAPSDSDVTYFKKSEYWDQSLKGDSALDFSSINPEYVKAPEAFFPITVIIKEATP